MANKPQPREPLGEHPPPPKDFYQRELPIIESQGVWYRLNSIDFASSLYFDRSGMGRFDDTAAEYGILYVGADQYAAFIECYGRVHGAIAVAESG